MLDVMTTRNASQISRDTKETWRLRAMGVTTIAMACLTYWAVFWLIPNMVAGIYDAATFTSPL